jgi:hypothetical protein
VSTFSTAAAPPDTNAKEEASMTPGFVKIHRKLLDNELLMGDAVLLKVFLWCVLKANWQDTPTLQRGQLRMGYSRACVPPGAGRRHLTAA